jgi:hypothetical protein
VYGAWLEEPLSYPEARRRAVEEAARFYGAIIYGWTFHYDIGEKARNIEEKLELSPLGAISPEDPLLQVTEDKVKDLRLKVWADYRPTEAQLKRLSMWRAGTTRSAQGLGHAPLDAKEAALEDAARSAIRAMLRAEERNRPKEAEGYISLAAFPRFLMDKGQWASTARFYVNITKIVPFSAY